MITGSQSEQGSSLHQLMLEALMGMDVTQSGKHASRIVVRMRWTFATLLSRPTLFAWSILIDISDQKVTKRWTSISIDSE